MPGKRREFRGLTRVEVAVELLPAKTEPKKIRKPDGEGGTAQGGQKNR